METKDEPRPIPAVFLVDVQCDWRTILRKPDKTPSFSRCLSCEYMVRGNPAPCPVLALRGSP